MNGSANVIETPRLSMRTFRPDDLDDLCALYADPEIRRYFPEGTLNRSQTKQELDWFIEGKYAGFPDRTLWATIHRQTGRFIGRCGFILWTIDGVEETEIAYLLDKSFWRQGLGAEAASALIRHGFERLKLSRLIALIDPGNIASKRTAEKAGLRFERAADVEREMAHIYAIEN